jgi:outer membrane protein OmpA-like peptidoglycan-associated protein
MHIRFRQSIAGGETNMRRRVLSLLATLAAVSPAAAQQAGTFEVGLFPQVSYFDKTLGMVQGRAGPGARLGYHFSEHLGIEAEGAWVPGEGRNGAQVSYIPLRARLALNVPAGEHVGLVFGAGYVQSLYKRDYDLSDAGVTGSAGVRLGLGDVTSIRIDTYVDYMPSPDNSNGAGNNLNFGIQPGLSFLLGQRTTKVRDKDGDGVPDAVDECKNTPPGDKVDAKGCTIKDSDGDGVLDDVDQCKDTPAGDKVDAKGCSLPKDADGDGVLDDVDQCKDTPAGDKVDAKGCSLPKDADGDGVTDDKDRCPHTPAGVKVDEEGCQVLFEKAKKSLILEGVNFATGKSELTPESQAILDGVAESLVANEEIKVQVGGHTDNTGSAAVNKRLSAARAEAVRQYLITKGVATDRLTAAGFGPSKPIASNKTAAGRAQNRRVELTRLN